jgi:integrase
LAALGHVYSALKLSDLTKDSNIVRLVSALVKSGTTKPMKKSTVLPVDKFMQLFESWDDNSLLSVKLLRLKAVTLLALALMLRPSDVAPNAQMFDSQTLQVQSVVFTKSMLRFTQDGMFVTVFGVKNDVQRSGFEVFLPKHENEKLDPVRTLWDYVTRTDSVRSGDAVFLSLNKPYKALSASAVAKVLEESIHLAGHSEMGFSAKSFRPTGATVAIESRIDPKIVQKCSVACHLL